jgi:hypothetical protein
MSCKDLYLHRESFFQHVFTYSKGSNLAGLVDSAEMQIYDGDMIRWIGVIPDEITADYPNGKFTVIIPESDVDIMDFDQARYRFRIRWIGKGWEVLEEGKLILTDGS